MIWLPFRAEVVSASCMGSSRFILASGCSRGLKGVWGRAVVFALAVGADGWQEGPDLRLGATRVSFLGFLVLGIYSLLQSLVSGRDVSAFLLVNGFVISLMDRLDLTFLISRVGRDSPSHPANPVSFTAQKPASWVFVRTKIKWESVSFSLAKPFRIEEAQKLHSSLRTAHEKKFPF